MESSTVRLDDAGCFSKTAPVCPLCERIDDLVEPRITAGGFENASHNAGGVIDHS